MPALKNGYFENAAIYDGERLIRPAKRPLLSTDVDRELSIEEHLGDCRWAMRACLEVLRQANAGKTPNTALALECGLRFKYWLERYIAFSSKPEPPERAQLSMWDPP